MAWGRPSGRIIGIMCAAGAVIAIAAMRHPWSPGSSGIEGDDRVRVIQGAPGRGTTDGSSPPGGAGRRVEPLTGVITAADAVAKLGFAVASPHGEAPHYASYFPAALAGRTVGDPINVLIPNLGFSINGHIATVAHSDGMSRIAGSLDNMPGQPNHFSITQVPGDHYAVATFETPMDTFVMEAKNGVAWFRAAKAEGQRLIDESDGVAAPPEHH